MCYKFSLGSFVSSALIPGYMMGSRLCWPVDLLLDFLVGVKVSSLILGREELMVHLILFCHCRIQRSELTEISSWRI